MNSSSAFHRAVWFSLLVGTLCLPVWGQIGFKRELRLAKHDLQDLAANSERFVAVGRTGLVATSEDGLNWFDQDAGTYESFLRISSFEDGFVTTGAAGSLFYSPNGIDWQQRLAEIVPGSLMVTADAMLVAAQDNATSWWHSTDGQDWVGVTPGFEAQATGTAAGMFFVTDPEGAWFVSVDGQSWEPASLPAGVTFPRRPSVSDGVFLTHGRIEDPESYYSVLLRSVDGLTWQTVATDSSVVGVYAEQSGFILLTQNSQYWSSADGLDWISVDVADLPESRLSDVTMGDIAVRPHDLARSVDGGVFADESIQPHYFGATGSAIAYGNGYWVTNAGYFSEDGVTWTGTDDPPIYGGYRSIPRVTTAGELYFWFNGFSINQMWVSRDRSSYIEVLPFPREVIPQVAFANDLYLIQAKDSSTIFLSSDGINWTEHPEALPSLFDSFGRPINVTLGRPHQLVAFRDTFLLHVPGTGFMRSNDGLNWEFWDSNLDYSSPLQGLTHNAGMLVAHDGRQIWTSTDAAAWTLSSNPPLSFIHQAVYSGSFVVAIGRDAATSRLNHLAARDDGGNWTRAVLAADGFSHGLASGKGLTLAPVGGQVWSARDGLGPVVTSTSPTEQAAFEDQVVSLDATIQSARPTTTHWADRTLNLAGADSVPLTRSFTQGEGSPTRALVLKVSDGTYLTSRVFNLTLYPNTPPQLFGSGIHDWTERNEAGGFDRYLRAEAHGPCLEYEWTRNGIPLATNGNVLKIPVNAFTRDDSYQVTVSNTHGEVTSEVFTLTDAPELTSFGFIEFVDYISDRGWGIEVEATGAWGYQWRRNGVPLTNETGPRLVLRALMPEGGLQDRESGFYDVLVYNDRETIRHGPWPFQAPTGEALPDDIPNLPWDPVQPPHLSNLSIRAKTETGDGALVPGFVLSGDNIHDQEAPAKVLLRGIGPGLVPYGVTNVIGNPRLQIRTPANELIAQNFHWADHPQSLDEVFESVGAFSLDPDSLDAALLHPISARQESTILTSSVVDTAGEPGETLVELYLTPEGNGSHLTNLSARGVIEPDRPLIAGFVIEGAGSLGLMMRVVGPGLEEFGVEQAAAAPQLRLFNGSGEQIGQSEDVYPRWVEPIQNAVGAFPVAPGPNNGIIVTELPAGTYTLQAQDETGGIALIEIYLMPLGLDRVIVPTRD